MASAADIAKAKAELIAKKESYLEKATSEAERKLLSALFNALLKSVMKNKGLIINEAGTQMELSAAINRVYETFRKTEGYKIIQQMGADIMQIVTLNQKYFSIVAANRAKQLQSLYSIADEQTRKRIGIDNKGNIVKDGYLERLITDKTLVNELKKETIKAFGKKATVEQYMNTLKKIVVGDKTKAGGLSHHFRTFAHDTFSQVDSEYGSTVASGLQLDAAQYMGGKIGTTRAFCLKKDGKVFTRKEIENWRNDPDLLMSKDEQNAGKPKDYDPIRDRGRWNCRHYLNWITDEKAISLRPELKNIPRDQWGGSGIKKKSSGDKPKIEASAPPKEEQTQLDSLMTALSKPAPNKYKSQVPVPVPKPKKPPTKKQKENVPTPAEETYKSWTDVFNNARFISYKYDDAITRFETEARKEANADLIEAVKDYTGNGYSVLNDKLRNDKELSPHHEKLLKRIDEAYKLGVFQTSENHPQVFRGIRFDDERELEDFLRQELSSDVFIDKGYMSTSIEYKTADGFSGGGTRPRVLFEIQNAIGLPVESISQVSREKEILLPRGARFKVISLKKAKKKQRYFGRTVEVTTVEVKLEMMESPIREYKVNPNLSWLD